MVKRWNNEPANLSCNGSFADPVSLGSSMLVNMTALSWNVGAYELLEGTRIDVWDPVAQTETGVFGITGENSQVFIPASDPGALKDSRRYSFRLTHPPVGTAEWADSYVYGALTPPLGTAKNLQLTIVKGVTLEFSLGLLYIEADEIAGTSHFAGAIDDCDHVILRNVWIEAPGPGGVGNAKLCGEEDHGFPCISYLRQGQPHPTATFVDGSQFFAVAGVPPGEDYTITAWGVVEEGGEPEMIGEITINPVVSSPCPTGVGNCSMSIFTTTPLPGFRYGP